MEVFLQLVNDQLVSETQTKLEGHRIFLEVSILSLV